MAKAGWSPQTATVHKRQYFPQICAGLSLQVKETRLAKKKPEPLLTHIEFSKVKIGFDCTMVLVSAITCLTILHNLGSVGVGTIIAAILVGTLVGIINRAFGKQRDKLLGKNDETAASSTESTSNYVITISREFGSGGREIGKILAERLGFHYYDSELIRLAAEKSGYTPEYVEQNEQALKKPVLHDFFAWYAGPL